MTMPQTFLLSLFLFLLSLPMQAQREGFSVSSVPDAVFQRMKGKSYKSGCTVPRSELRYVRVLHHTLEGEVKHGEIVCHRRIANDLLEIFQELFRARYPIAQIRLIDDFDADDTRSMEANNTSCFNFRRVKGSRSLSKHALGLAIDINPLFNPHVSQGGARVNPAAGKAYADRQKNFPHKLSASDLCVKLFKAHGFRWGGDWRHSKDYQHFEK